MRVYMYMYIFYICKKMESNIRALLRTQSSSRQFELKKDNINTILFIPHCISITEDIKGFQINYRIYFDFDQHTKSICLLRII